MITGTTENVSVLQVLERSAVCALLEVNASAPQSPAERTQRIHAGDEVVQVNQQTVVSPRPGSELAKPEPLSAAASVVPSGASGIPSSASSCSVCCCLGCWRPLQADCCKELSSDWSRWAGS